MTEPSWLAAARRYLGVAEIKGPHHNPKILKMLDQADGKIDGRLLQGIRDDETPWCATFVSAVLEESGIASSRSAWARSYLKWGKALKQAVPGAIIILERGPSSGHVFFAIGRDARGNIVGIGGNQGDAVTIASFAPPRVIGIRWPATVAVRAGGLPLVSKAGKLSTNEA